MNEPIVLCAICTSILNQPWTQNPNIVCQFCSDRATDSKHNSVQVMRNANRAPDDLIDYGQIVAYNTSNKNLEGDYTEINKEVSKNRKCFIDGIVVEFLEEGDSFGLVVSESQTEFKTELLNDANTQPCGVCRLPVKTNQRYPAYVCWTCQERAVDSLHRPVYTANKGVLGTGEAAYLRFNPAGTDGDVPSEPANETKEIYIDGVKCSFQEARFGGIVVQVAGKERKPFEF